jgi:ankyrin repeat protein
VNSNAAAVDARNGAGDTPLTVAAREGQLKTVLALLAAGADVHGG